MIGAPQSGIAHSDPFPLPENAALLNLPLGFLLLTLSTTMFSIPSPMCHMPQMGCLCHLWLATSGLSTCLLLLGSNEMSKGRPDSS